MIKTLYIIGNGFDIAHGIKSKYYDFKMWLKENEPLLLQDIEDVWANCGELWSDFEMSLGEVDFMRVWEKFRDYHIQKFTIADNEFRRLNTSFPPSSEFHTLAEKLRPLTRNIRLAFDNWVLSLNQSVVSMHPIISFDKNAFFVTFNYTETLEIVYKIPRKSILYIHGRANSEDELLFGHNKSSIQIEYEIEQKHLGSGNTAVNDFSLWIGSLNKNVDYNLYKVSPSFDILTDIEQINIYGYSFNMIDSVYMEDLFERTYNNHPHWNISYYSDEDFAKISNFVQSHGMSGEEYTFLKLSDISFTVK